MKKSQSNKNLLNFLAKEAVNKLHCDISGVCAYGAELITPKLLSNGFKDFYVVEGYVKVPDWTGRTQHTWIELYNGEIVDPTFEQFPKGTTRLDSFRKKYRPQQYLNEMANAKHKVPDGINRYASSITDGFREFLGFVFEAKIAPPAPKNSKPGKSEPSSDVSPLDAPKGKPMSGGSKEPTPSPDSSGKEPSMPPPDSGGDSGAGGMGGSDIFGPDTPPDGPPTGGEEPPAGEDEKSKISNYSEKLKASKVIKFQKLEPEPGYKFDLNDKFYSGNYVGKTKNGSILLAVPKLQGGEKEQVISFIKKMVLPKIEPVVKNALSQRKRVVLIGDHGMPYVKGKYSNDEQGIIAKYLNDKYKGGYVIFDSWAPQEYYAFISNDELWKQVKERTEAENIEIKSALYLYLLTTISGRKFANKLKTPNVLKMIGTWGLDEKDVSTLSTQGLNKIASIVYPELTSNPETLTSFIIKTYLQLLRVNMMQKVLKYEKEGKLVIVLSDEHTAWTLKNSFDKSDEMKKEPQPKEKPEAPPAETAPKGEEPPPAPEKGAPPEKEPPTAKKG